jgi:hypothetical protein
MTETLFNMTIRKSNYVMRLAQTQQPHLLDGTSWNQCF